MRRVQIQRQPNFDRKKWLLHPAADGHFDRLIVDHGLLYEGDRLVMAFMPASAGHGSLLAALRSIEFKINNRTAGMRSQSRTFAFMPRRTLRNDYCSRSLLAEQNPKAHETLLRWGAIASDVYSLVNPDEHARSEEAIKGVREEWRIPNSVFTSGICNADNALRYHVDAGNFPHTWSAMYAFTRDIVGGYFVLPEFRVALDFHQPSLVMFEGQHELHGVTPIRKRGSLGYRYSVVYYALKGMCACGSLTDEVERIRAVRLTRERKRAGKTP